MNPNVTKVDIIKVPKMIMHNPVTYHSRVKLASLCAISVRAKNWKINAKAERNPSIAVMVAELLKFFIIVNCFIFFSLDFIIRIRATNKADSRENQVIRNLSGQQVILDQSGLSGLIFYHKVPG